MSLFGQGPTKIRPKYAKFEVAEPSVNLSLNEVAGPTGQTNAVAHFGIQVKSVDVVHELAERFKAAGLETDVEEQVACCYAVQSKVWVSDPDGNRWEVFVVLDSESDQYADDTKECCSDVSETACCGSAEACCE